MKRAKDDWPDLLDQLEDAVAADAGGQERRWAEGVATALARVEQALAGHVGEAEAPGGMFAEVDQKRPSLVRQVGELRREHVAFPDQARALRDRLRAGTDATLREDFRQFAAALRRHREVENDLVQESVTTDYGAGD